MRIAFGTDDHTDVTAAIRAHLVGAGHDVLALPDVVRSDGTAGAPEWPMVGRAVGELVSTGSVERGVVCCWTGTGVSIAANKVPSVRAALCTDVETARGARRWNDANVLAIGLRLTTAAVAIEMLDVFLATDPDSDHGGLIAGVEADQWEGAGVEPGNR